MTLQPSPDAPETPAPPARRRLLAPLAAGLIVLALLIGGGIAAFVASQSAGSDAPPAAGPFVTPAPAYPVAVFDVREVNGGELTLLPANVEGEALTVRPAAGATFEALTPAAPARLARGQWLTLVGEGDPVRNYVIRAAIALAEPGAPQADGMARSPAGFTGLELLSDPDQRPILWGRIESVADGDAEGVTEVTLAGPDGTITIRLVAESPLYIVEPYTTPITDGDRIATRTPAGASPATATAILISPQGAR